MSELRRAAEAVAQSAQYTNSGKAVVDGVAVIALRYELSKPDELADDDESVTEEWLRSAGFIRDDCPSAKWTFRRDEALPIGLWNVSDGWKAVLILSERASANIVRGQNTRGDVRRLCLALGIKLTEGT